jgi:hypothetical protein
MPSWRGHATIKVTLHSTLMFDYADEFVAVCL